MSLSVSPTNGRSQILVFGSVEGTAVANDYSLRYGCGVSGPTLVSQVASNNLGAFAIDQGAIPYLLGMGHVVIAPQTTSPVPYDPHAMNSVSLLVGDNLNSLISVAIGGNFGDGKVGFVKQP